MNLNKQFSIEFLIKSTPNNFVITYRIEKGSTIKHISPAVIGFVGRQKRTKAACISLIKYFLTKIMIHLKKKPILLKIFFKGAFKWRRDVLKLLKSFSAFEVIITELSSLCHNGCRLSKAKRK